MHHLRLILALLFLACFSVAQAMTVHVIELQNYPADEFIQTINPVLMDGESATAIGHKIILRADQSTIDIVESIVSKVDKPLRNILIRVRNNQDSHSQNSGYSLSGNIGNEHIQVSTESSPWQTRNHARITLNRGSVNNNRNGEQEIRGVEGQPAFIAVGQSIPFSNRQYFIDQQGNLVEHRQTEFKDVIQGFFVTARLIGENRVTLTISYSDDKLKQNSRRIID
ncbi:MAG: hypothetical protein KDI30_03825, partial [Pseudomonadales bacterium]|nr:hypothetical protein [Pseudomonadales bacterium]